MCGVLGLLHVLHTYKCIIGVTQFAIYAQKQRFYLAWFLEISSKAFFTKNYIMVKHFNMPVNQYQ